MTKIIRAAVLAAVVVGWVWAAVFHVPAANAAIFASLDPASMDRFVSGTDPNPTFVLDEAAISGIGVGAGAGARVALITPRHYITAAHASTNVARLRGADGTVRDYSTSGFVDLVSDFPGSPTRASDIRLYTLTEAIPISDGILPLAILDAPESTLLPTLVGREFFVYDKSQRVGRNVIDDVVLASFNETTSERLTATILYNFDTDTNGGSGGLDDEAGLDGGDSGRAALIDVDGTLALIGSHFGIDVSGPGNPNNRGRYASFSSLLSPYLDDIEAVTQAQGGYALNRVAFDIVAVPEPSSIAVLGGLAVVAVWRRRRARSSLKSEPSLRRLRPNKL